MVNARIDRQSRWRCARPAAALLAFVLVVSVGETLRAALFTAPSPASADEIVLLSTRQVGTWCSTDRIRHRLKCQRYQIAESGLPEWKSTDWRRLLSERAAERPTIIYVHGNRVAPGEDRADGMEIYRSLKASGGFAGPVRLIIWSWPATPLPRPVRDYQIKAGRTGPVAWQLAWFLDQLPAETHVSLVGYSYGARVVSGAAHVLAGGALNGLKLTERVHPERTRMRVALLAAAYDANWNEPGHLYGRSVSQLGRLIVTTNDRDPVMRFYHLSNGRGHMDALGKRGVARPATLGTSARRVRQVDFTDEVGRSHSLEDYLAATAKMAVVWRELAAASESPRRDRVVAR